MAEQDSDDDGTIDFRETLTYDIFGNLLTVVSDANADGIVDFSATYTWAC